MKQNHFVLTNRTLFTTLIIFFSDQYNSKAESLNGLPLCFDPLETLELFTMETDTWIRNATATVRCPKTCTSILYDGSASRFQTGSYQIITCSC